MNIWIFNHYAKTPDFSSGTRHFDMAKELIEKGHKVTIFASSFTHYDKKENIIYKNGQRFLIEYIDGIRFVWIKTFKYNGGLKRIFNMFSYYINAKKASRKLQINRPEIVIGSTVHLLAALLGKKVAKKNQAKFFFEERDFWPQTFIDFNILSKNNPISLILFRVEKSLYNSADKIIVLFDRADQYVMNKGVRAEKIIYLPNGITRKVPKYSYEIEKIMMEYKNKKTIIYTGSHGEANELFKVIYLAEIMSDYKDIVFLLFGEGNQKKNLINYVRKHNIQNVIFHDSVKKHQIPFLLSKCDVSIISIKDSPLYNFGFSMNKIYDYLYAGLPLIMLTNPKLAESFDRTGIFISDDLDFQKNNILQLFKDDDFYTLSSKSTKELSEKFLWENQIEKLDNSF
ncbi:glycosyltransferase WbuB [Jeotgalicoccus nanhaiensis]|uniref:Glycosyltransferase family 4 protein n=1 Tax=Jeotgalicoccus nanhaiensis TaxID=568603 RepID=A0ABR9XXQ3_9STAP|nr:glycosyltransferase family 4 protein [Jeotgalicoccus nanhaiensis]MBF0753495.1 glycosyltransferase family 4 protein [Jeotgalicoccus nanhaiensis]TFU62651.1 glycosyltransferase WbuB [Jeotgalicoccus nanhaiensis]